VEITLNDSSLASQAAGPPLSVLEMSAASRQFPDIGRKMYALRPLAQQAVAADDSVLGAWRHSTGMGLTPANYRIAVQAAFRPEWWKGSQKVTVGGKSYDQAEANFSLFFGLALQLYQATLVSDQAPYDQWAAGNASALTAEQRTGLSLFLGKGKCIDCHSGPVFTDAAIQRKPLGTERMSKMVMGDGKKAVYDEGFYNIGVTRTAEDLGVGGKDPWGRPLSFSGLAKQSSSLFTQLEKDVPNVSVSSTSRIAVNGAFKTPTLRNVELTAPYMHNGSLATLEQVVQFYNRGGNFAKANIADLDSDIKPLGLNASERAALVAFMKSLTDERVRKHAGVFDHPELLVPNGHVGDTRSVQNDGFGRARDEWLRIPAVGRHGYSASQIPASFQQNLDKANSEANAKGFMLKAAHSGKCIDVAGGGTADGAVVQQWTCHGGNNQRFEEVPVAGGFMLRAKHSGKCLDVAGISTAAGAKLIQWGCHGGANQVFNWSGSRLVVSHTKMCVDVARVSTADFAAVIQWSCHGGANQSFSKQ
jgi:cytochrome c peroxidase